MKKYTLWVEHPTYWSHKNLQSPKLVFLLGYLNFYVNLFSTSFLKVGFFLQLTMLFVKVTFDEVSCFSDRNCLNNPKTISRVILSFRQEKFCPQNSSLIPFEMSVNPEKQLSSPFVKFRYSEKGHKNMKKSFS